MIEIYSFSNARNLSCWEIKCQKKWHDLEKFSCEDNTFNVISSQNTVWPKGYLTHITKSTLVAPDMMWCQEVFMWSWVKTPQNLSNCNLQSNIRRRNGSQSHMMQSHWEAGSLWEHTPHTKTTRTYNLLCGFRLSNLLFSMCKQCGMHFLFMFLCKTLYPHPYRTKDTNKRSLFSQIYIE